ncbi:hypothetical protein SDC9_136130 [bioreactor metagenome]|uniref:Uncharacterized protein n=1 Tax=bioreactor metagenome TaxID=1076179 RepID=A0A645DKC7_9ZZZZ
MDYTIFDGLLSTNTADRVHKGKVYTTRHLIIYMRCEEVILFLRREEGYASTPGITYRPMQVMMNQNTNMYAQ